MLRCCLSQLATYLLSGSASWTTIFPSGRACETKHSFRPNRPVKTWNGLGAAGHMAIRRTMAINRDETKHFKYHFRTCTTRYAKRLQNCVYTQWRRQRDEPQKTVGTRMYFVVSKTTSTVRGRGDTRKRFQNHQNYLSENRWFQCTDGGRVSHLPL